MQTTFKTLMPDGVSSDRTIDLDEFPRRDRLRQIVEPYLGGAMMLHVLVLDSSGQSLDMFVDALAISKHLPVNVEATRLYRAAHLMFHPDDDPDTLPCIAGPAVLFMRSVIDDRPA